MCLTGRNSVLIPCLCFLTLMAPGGTILLRWRLGLVWAGNKWQIVWVYTEYCKKCIYSCVSYKNVQLCRGIYHFSVGQESVLNFSIQKDRFTKSVQVQFYVGKMWLTRINNHISMGQTNCKQASCREACWDCHCLSFNVQVNAEIMQTGGNIISLKSLVCKHSYI